MGPWSSLVGFRHGVAAAWVRFPAVPLKRKEIFNIPREPLERALDQIYDPASCGIALLPQAFFPGQIQEILQEINHNKHYLLPAKQKQGVAEQHFYKYYWGTAENGKNENFIFPLASHFAQRYSEIMCPLLTARSLTQTEVNSIGIHIYPISQTNGISPHRDLSSIQLVSSVVISGFAPFYTAKDHNLIQQPQMFQPRSLSLLLMRGPRNEEERMRSNSKNASYNHQEDLRPIHSVGRVEKERTVLLLRHISENLKSEKEVIK